MISRAERDKLQLPRWNVSPIQHMPKSTSRKKLQYKTIYYKFICIISATFYKNSLQIFASFLRVLLLAKLEKNKKKQKTVKVKLKPKTGDKKFCGHWILFWHFKKLRDFQFLQKMFSFE